MGTKIHIRNMVCNRCKMAVRQELQKGGFQVGIVELGEVEILNEVDLPKIKSLLEPLGFGLLDDRKSKVIEKVKTLIIDLIYNRNNELRTNLSGYLASGTGHDYSAISQTFSQNEGVTIEQYYILQKIERVKELLAYGELNLNEIADSLNYSSASHLSRQFRKITGMTPGEFRKIRPVRQGPAGG